MQKKYILNCVSPPITSYPIIASTMSILWADKFRTTPWICDHFVQLVGRKKSHSRYQLHGNFFEYEEGANQPLFLKCPFLFVSRFDIDLIKKHSKKIDFSKLLKYYLDNNYFIHMCLDHFYFSCAEFYNKEHHMHPTFIYGYDDFKKQFFIKDFFKNKYSEKTVSYKEMNLAFDECKIQKSYHRIINLLKYTPLYYELNLDKIIRNYTDYLNGCDTTYKYKEDIQYGDLTFSYGIRYYDVLDHQLCNKDIDIRIFHVLYDHKVIQSMRIKYLFDNNYITNPELIEKSDLLEQKALNLRNLVLKYLISQNQADLNEAISLCKHMKEYDREYVLDLLNELNNNHNTQAK